MMMMMMMMTIPSLNNLFTSVNADMFYLNFIISFKCRIRYADSFLFYTCLHF